MPPADLPEAPHAAAASPGAERILVDPQHEGAEHIDAVRAVEQQQFFAQLGIADLLDATRTDLAQEPA